MLAKKYRLSVQDFIKKKPARTRRSDFFMFKHSNNNLPYSRFAVIVSKKISSKATRRIWVKRDIFEYLRKNNFFARPGQDVLVTVLKNPEKKGEKTWHKDLEDFFKHESSDNKNST